MLIQRNEMRSFDLPESSLQFIVRIASFIPLHVARSMQTQPKTNAVMRRSALAAIPDAIKGLNGIIFAFFHPGHRLHRGWHSIMAKKEKRNEVRMFFRWSLIGGINRPQENRARNTCTLP